MTIKTSICFANVNEIKVITLIKLIFFLNYKKNIQI